MKKALLAALAVLPVTVAGTFTNAKTANAAALVGGFQYSSFANGISFTPTTATLKKNSVDFSPNDARILLSLQTGSFTGFAGGVINDIIPLPTATQGAITNNPFIDLEASPFGPPYGAPADGQNVFNLTEVRDYEIKQSGNNVAIDLAVFGFFKSATGEETKGAGNLTFQYNNISVAAARNLIDTNGLAASFSGAAFTTVPEPASMLGLGLVGGSILLSRRRKVAQK